MITRILLVVAGGAGVVGVAYVVISTLAVHIVENGASRHVVDGTGVIRGLSFLALAVFLLLVAFVVRPAH